MNKRKQHVIHIAYQLFVEKGFQATSIQDILDCSGISKGTFYNYFSSKSELLISVFKWLHEKMEDERNQLLIGQELSDIDIFCKQMILYMKNNKRNKLLNLYREVFVSNDKDLVQFIKQRQVLEIRWTMERLTDIFGVDKRPYLLDCSIMFMGIVQQNLQYNQLDNKNSDKANEIIRYSVTRLSKMVEEVSTSREQLLDPVVLEQWLPDITQLDTEFNVQFIRYHVQLEDFINKHSTREDREKLIELLEFLKEELAEAKQTRTYVIESALSTLEENPLMINSKDFQDYQSLIHSYLLEKRK